mmetsp:Transcript_32717/g.82484  ORF Transcript_32717/g.82484 Transcript_32717/m.82484 type:complete len:471 (-) Transcript_32717:404-1816(-)
MSFFSPSCVTVRAEDVVVYIHGEWRVRLSPRSSVDEAQSQTAAVLALRGGYVSKWGKRVLYIKRTVRDASKSNMAAEIIPAGTRRDGVKRITTETKTTIATRRGPTRWGERNFRCSPHLRSHPHRASQRPSPALLVLSPASPSTCAVLAWTATRRYSPWPQYEVRTVRTSWLSIRLRHGEGLDVPDLRGVLVNGAVRVELAGKGGGDDGGLGPCHLVLVRRVHLGLALDVRPEVLSHQEVVPAPEALVALEARQKLVELPLAAEHARLNGVHHRGEAHVGHKLPRRTLGARRLHLRLLDAEEEEIFVAHALADLHVSAVQRADDEAAVHLELHVGRAGRLGAGSADVLRQLRGGDQRLGQRHVVVGDKHHLKEVADFGVVVDDITHGGDQAHDALGLEVGGVRLAAEDAHAWGDKRALLRGHGLHLVVAVDDAHDVEQLPLVLVDALDLDVEHGVRGHLDAGGGQDEVGA